MIQVDDMSVQIRFLFSVFCLAYTVIITQPPQVLNARALASLGQASPKQTAQVKNAMTVAFLGRFTQAYGKGDEREGVCLYWLWTTEAHGAGEEREGVGPSVRFT
jgi:hypothetical protein